MKANQKYVSLREDKTAIARVVGGLVALLVAIIIGVLVFYAVNDALAFSDDTARAAAAATWTNVNSTANTVWTLLPIIGIVVIAGIILAVVIGFGGKRGGL